MYNGETGRTLKKRLYEHKQAVVKFDVNNGVVAHVHKEDHQIDWEGTKVVRQQELYWKRRMMEAIQIHRCSRMSMNLDCGCLSVGYGMIYSFHGNKVTLA